MLTELDNQQRKAALDKFATAIWEDQDPAKLLPLAGPAGLTGDQADALIARISQAKRQLAEANCLPRLRKDATAAGAKYDRLETRYNAETARLGTELDEAAFAADTARKAVYAAEDSARRLLALHDEGLLLAEVPREVVHLMDRRLAEANLAEAQQAMIAAGNERCRLRGTVQDIEYRLAHVPISLDQQRQEHFLRDRLKEAKAELAKAESKLKKAEAATEAARKAIPGIQ